MTTYYVRKTGSDAAAGTSAGAAWLTLGRAVDGTGVGDGDTCWIGAGTYPEVLSPAMSLTVETFFIGDTDGSHTGDAGEVVITSYLTDYKTAASASTILDIFNQPFLTFEKITFVAGNSPIFGSNAVTTNVTFRECSFIGGDTNSYIGSITAAFATDAAWLFDRCRIFSTGNGFSILLTRGTGADYDAGIVFRNCHMLIAQHGIAIGGDGAGANLGGGVVVENCTIFTGAGDAVETTATSVSTSIPAEIRNSVVISGFDGLFADTSGEIVENYNVIYAGVAPSNVTQGADSIWNVSSSTYAPLIHIGQELQYGANLRPYGMPTAGSPLLGFGGTSPPAVDLLNAPRPAGGESDLAAVGAYERGNTFARETTTVRTGSNAISITGPGYQDFALPVPASARTVTAYVRWDATYAGTKPKMQVINGTECGVADDTDTATGSSGAWEQLSLAFTPTAAGIVTIRFLSGDTNGGGAMFVDDFEVAA